MACTNIVCITGKKNITLSADARSIEASRQRAASERTTSNEQFRRWLSDSVGGTRQASDAVQVMRELRGRLHIARKPTREEMNER